MALWAKNKVANFPSPAPPRLFAPPVSNRQKERKDLQPYSQASRQTRLWALRKGNRTIERHLMKLTIEVDLNFESQMKARIKSRDQDPGLAGLGDCGGGVKEGV